MRIIRGNLLESDSEAIVNTVNTVGVMGKGIALQFRDSFPVNYKLYKAACKEGEVKIGKMFVTTVGQLGNPRFIINFPTKEHWKNPSQIDYIKSGLIDLKNVIKKLNIKSISIPPLGSGSGGLNWLEVRPLIVEALGDLKDVDVFIYEPDKKMIPNKRIMSIPKLTPARAMIVEILKRYKVLGFRSTLVETQKLAWFLQRLGEDLNLDFKKNFYGPYANQLSYLLQEIDGYYIQGMKYRTIKPFEYLDIVDRNYKDVLDFTEKELSPLQRKRLETLTKLIEGFETPLGMELLATVDFVISSTGQDLSDPEIVRAVQNWSQRKSVKLKPHHIEIAHRRLREFSTELEYKNNA